MIKKIIHISDLHIRTLQYHELYKRQFIAFIDDLEDQLKGYSFDEVRIAITGDIFHQKITISNEQLLLASWFLDKLTKFGVVIILPGNHDFLENNLDRIDSISPIIDLLNNKKTEVIK